MNVTVVCGTFSPQLGYHEVHLSRAIAGLGHNVTVLTSTLVPPAHRPYVGRESYEPGESRLEGMKVIRVEPRRVVGTALYPPPEAAELLRQSRPDAVIALGVSKCLPMVAVEEKERCGYRLAVVFGDHSLHRRGLSGAVKGAAFRALKKRWYSQACREADMVVCTVPETVDFLSGLLGNEFEQSRGKCFVSPLGFDPSLFRFDPQARARLRRELGADGSFVFITAGKPSKGKRWEELLLAFNALEDKGSALLVVGGAKAKLSSGAPSERVQLLPFQPPDRLSALYSASDAGVFLSPSITILEAMGTGLPLILPRSRILEHYLSGPRTGLYFSGGLGDALVQGLGFQGADREKISEANSRFAYPGLARELLERLFEESGIPGRR